VEVDGLWNQRRIALDERRDRKLTRLGYQVLHLDAALVMQQPRNCVSRTSRATALQPRHSAICTKTIPRRETTPAPRRLHVATNQQNEKERTLSCTFLLLQFIFAEREG
jgi:hypothetical protein